MTNAPFRWTLTWIKTCRILCLALVMASGAMGLSRAAEIEMMTRSGAIHRFSAEIMRRPEETARGLMFRTELDQDAAMVFVFEPPQPVQFWMRNTLIPLDMIFIDAEGVIQKIVTRLDTQSDQVTQVKRAIAWVVEINAGEAERRFIEAGDRFQIVAPSSGQ